LLNLVDNPKSNLWFGFRLHDYLFISIQIRTSFFLSRICLYLLYSKQLHIDDTKHLTNKIKNWIFFIKLKLKIKNQFRKKRSPHFFQTSDIFYCICFVQLFSRTIKRQFPFKKIFCFGAKKIFISLFFGAKSHGLDTKRSVLNLSHTNLQTTIRL
jgi:hypothetical protein